MSRKPKNDRGNDPMAKKSVQAKAKTTNPVINTRLIAVLPDPAHSVRMWFKPRTRRNRR